MNFGERKGTFIVYHGSLYAHIAHYIYRGQSLIYIFFERNKLIVGNFIWFQMYTQSSYLMAICVIFQRIPCLCAMQIDGLDLGNPLTGARMAVFLLHVLHRE